jgi:integrase
VDELTAVEIQMFINGMIRSGASHSLLQKAVTHLRAILDQAEELDIIVRNPMRSRTVRVEYKSRKRKSERYLSLEERRALLSMLIGRDHLIIRMFIQLGRAPRNFSHYAGTTSARNSFGLMKPSPRGRSRKRRQRSRPPTYMPPDLMVELRTRMESTPGKNEDWLFPASHRRGSASFSPMSQNNYRNRVLKPAAKKAGIPCLDLLTLRRTCATHFGQKATMQMRHADPWTTLQYYQQSIPESVKRAAVALEAEILKKAERPGETIKTSAKVVN